MYHYGCRAFAIVVPSLVLAISPLAHADWQSRKPANHTDEHKVVSDIDTPSFLIVDEDVSYDDELGQGFGTTTTAQTASSCSASVHGKGNVDVSAYAFPGLLDISPTGPYSAAATCETMYSYALEWYWSGCDVPEARNVNLTVTGGATLSVTATTSPNPGSNAGVTATASGAAGSLDPASASIPGGTSITANVQYDSATSTYSAYGNIGAAITPPSSGGMSIASTAAVGSSSSWATVGSGVQTGSATYTALPARAYSASTDKSYIITYNGNALANGTGNWSVNLDSTEKGSMEYLGTAQVNLKVIGGG